jgi:hypothetical protein
MKYEGISFNRTWIASLTEEQFMAEANINQHWFANDPDREQKLKDVYALATLTRDQYIEVIEAKRMNPVVEHIDENQNEVGLPAAGE